jgi:hypothetical protein
LRPAAAPEDALPYAVRFALPRYGYPTAFDWALRIYGPKTDWLAPLDPTGRGGPYLPEAIPRRAYRFG